MFPEGGEIVEIAGMKVVGHLGSMTTDGSGNLVWAPFTHSRFFLEELPGVAVATSHVPGPDGQPVALPAAFAIPRSINPAGGLISSARDQLRWARFHLGDGRVPGSGRRLLTPRSIRAMRSRPGPGGTLFVEGGGSEGKAFLGIGAKDGKILWTLGDGVTEAGYSSTLPVDVVGMRQYVHYIGDKLRGVDVTGKELWSYPWPQGETHAIPIFVPPDKIFGSGAEGARIDA